MAEQENKPQEHKSSDSLYLDKLQFNPELRKSFLNFFVSNFRVVVLLMMIITVFGIYSYMKLPVESTPEVKIPMAVVITTYPGASPADIEELVTKKIETGIAGLKNIKTITSKSSNSISSITVEYDASADLKDSIRELRDEVSNIKTDLPDDANDPIVKEISLDDTPILTASIAGPYDGFTIRKYAEDIQKELEKIPGVREVNVSGGDTAEFEVAYDPAKLIYYGITADQANQLIKAVNIAVPGGSFDGEKFTYSVRSDARFFDADKLGDTPITHTDSGAFIFLKDIAKVTETSVKRTIYSRFSSYGKTPENAVTIQIIKKTGGSILNTAEQAKETINTMLKKMPSGLRSGITIDVSKEIKENFDQLVHDFLLTIALVFIILLIVIGLKEALVAGLAVPLVFFVTFAVMLNIGISLNFLSMFSLILALGLLVDDAIVVVSATKQYLKTGKFTPEEAVLLVLNDFKVVLTTTTLTTVWAFLPLLLATGIIGEYIKSIPITVSVTLISSLLIALMINHPLAAVLERIRMDKKFFFAITALLIIAGLIGLGSGLIGFIFFIICVVSVILMLRWYFFKQGKSALKINEELAYKEWRDEGLIKKKLKDQGNAEESENWYGRFLHGIFHMDRVLPYYEKALNFLISGKKTRRRSLILVFILFIGSIMMPATGILKSEFFPPSDSETVFVNIEAPVGMKLDETNKIAEQVEEKLAVYPEISDFSTLVGTGSAGGTISSSSGSGNPSNSGAITLRLVDKKERNITSYDFADKVREDLSSIKGATITVSAESGGPPSGSAFEAHIQGDDLQTLDKIANELKPLLSSIPGVINIDISLKASPAEYSFELDPDRLEYFGLNAASVGSFLRMAISGTEVTKVIRDAKEIKVIATIDSGKIPDLTSVQNLQMINSNRQPVFLKDVAKIELKPSVATITRIDQKRTVVLSAGVTGTTSNIVVAEFQKKLAKQYSMSEGYSISYGGENEQNNESVLSILRAMVVAFLLIISTLVIQFNSFKKAFIVVFTIPLALIGVFFGMSAARITLSFPALIGIVALFGIVVKNAIILVDKINLNLKSGIPFKTSVVDAAKSRLEAIVITSVCTIAGILPVTLSNETWMALGGAVIFGLFLSSFLTLFVIPILFVTLIREDELF